MVTELETSATKGNHREVRLGSKADYEAKLSSDHFWPFLSTRAV